MADEQQQSAPLTPDELAEIREHLDNDELGIDADDDIAVMERLLATVRAQQAEIERLTLELKNIHAALDREESR